MLSIFEVYYSPLDWTLWSSIRPRQDKSQMYSTCEFLDRLDGLMYQDQYMMGSCSLKQSRFGCLAGGQTNQKDIVLRT